MLAVVVQFALGFFHHRAYKQTQKTTRMAPIHVWLGRLVIPCGIANGFLYASYPSPVYSYILMSPTVVFP